MESMPSFSVVSSEAHIDKGATKVSLHNWPSFLEKVAVKFLKPELNRHAEK